MRAAQKLLCAPTIGRGVPEQGVVVGESKESNMPSNRPECTKTAKNDQFPTLIDLKIA
jgi:hypothetical protein